MLEQGPPAGDWQEVRLESPGKSLIIEKALIEHGGGCVEALEPGRLHDPAAWFAGFSRVLSGLPGHWPYHNRPADVLELFDKRVCHRRLERAGIPVIPGLDPERLGEERAFLKLFCASSCSGSLAYLGRGRGGLTTIERLGPGRYYNSRRVRRYPAEPTEEFVGWLRRVGVHTERWLPKARRNGLDFDLRLLVVGGRSRQLVLRCGRTPMLSLHLGSRRESGESLRPWLGESGWARVHELGERVAAVFPGCLYLGLDILVEPDRNLHLIEANAFGDLLPGLLWQGQDSYTLELQAFSKRNSA